MKARRIVEIEVYPQLDIVHLLHKSDTNYHLNDMKIDTIGIATSAG